ncbi:MAG: LysR family transcriptional regulator [Lachnospiraceae bacterium]|nr:LysR family transcriptional regulator [Lachnospiraceae bacterium]
MEANLNLYYIFYTVANCKNISAAAKELYISQPAISKAISKLESNLETVLFLRNSRGVTLTEEGEYLYEQIKTAFICIQNGEERIKKMNELGVGHLTIGVSTTLCKFLLLPSLSKFKKENPHIKIKIMCQTSSETLNCLDNGTIDIGLIGLPKKLRSYQSIPFLEIQDSFVTTESYLQNLGLREGVSPKEALKNATFMMLDSENISRKYVEQYLQEESMEPDEIMEVGNMDLLIEFAKIDLGIACVIKEFIQKELQSGDLITISLGNEIPKRQVGFVYSYHTCKDNPAVEKFIHSILEQNTNIKIKDEDR